MKRALSLPSVMVAFVSVVMPTISTEAQVPGTHVETPNTDSGERPFILSAGAGAGLLLASTDDFSAGRRTPVDVTLVPSLEIGGHLLAVDDHPGLFLTLSGGSSLGARIGARLGFDFRVAWSPEDDIEVLISPSGLLGLSFYQDLVRTELAVDLHLVLLDGRFGLWLRPLAIEFGFVEAFSVQLNILAGVEMRL